MTNETTASQPKSTPQEKIPQESIGDDAQFVRKLATYWQHSSDESRAALIATIDNWADSRAPAAQASATIQAAHPDDLAVQAFADAMKAKMAKSRAKGRGGWEECHAGDLRRMLVDHMAKGDPVDVGNFAMMLWNRGESTAATIQEPVMVAEQNN